MTKTSLHQQIATMRQSFFDEEILGEHFVQVEKLDDDNPHFLEKVLTSYFRESSEAIAILDQALEKPFCNLMNLERPIYKLKGSSASIGAIKVCKEVNHAIECCRERNMEGVKAAMERVKNEHNILRSKLEPYFQMLRQAGPSERADRPK
ncbi:pseudo histidine-containing phosphotransfer protein 5-like [Momordica charantia]|uniref:Histidine-containing phosphotransfer protein n=1 Tax=Momordica charantia TaxID=3673 RepID=A0A6J1DK51_MOMCH|nr:pseudo histidine-containing phosphotransfer protein 5-like [Momordica charantia]